MSEASCAPWVFFVSQLCSARVPPHQSVLHNRTMEPVAESLRGTAARYRHFAEVESMGQSARYRDWALGIAADADIVSLIDELPVAKRQPNLVFAAARAAGAPIGEYQVVRAWILEHWPQTREIALARSTQTNEAARCAVLLPLLAALPQPLALIEVGASAGLCLFPDRYSYRFGQSRLDPTDGPSAVLLEPTLTGPVPVPERMPTIVWRAGIDLNPLDVNDDDDLRWLETLVWPEHDSRRARMLAAAAIARRDPPRIVKSDAIAGLAALAAEAPADATLVVFHSAVLAYFTAQERERFARLVGELRGHWISNEGLGVLPEVRARLTVKPPDPGLFVVAQDGHPVAFAGGHGQSLHWMG